MKKIGKKAMRLCSVALLLIVALSSLCSSVFAGTGYYRVHILVAYDEEWRSIAWNKYLYTPEYLAWIFIDDIGYEFYRKYHIIFEIVEYMEYESDDSSFICDTRLDEVIWDCRTAGDPEFTSGHKTQAGNLVHILIAFTDQTITNCYGISDWGVGAVLVQEYTYPEWHPIQEQHTDNILQHELSHLWECEDHNIHNYDCVMNEWRDREGDLPYTMFTNNWCSCCENIIVSNIGKWGYEISGGGGGGLYKDMLW